MRMLTAVFLPASDTSAVSVFIYQNKQRHPPLIAGIVRRRARQLQSEASFGPSGDLPQEPWARGVAAGPDAVLAWLAGWQENAV